MIKFSYVPMLCLLLCIACSKSEKETKSGLKYTVIKAGTGNAPKTGELLVFDFQLKDSKDSVWNDSYKEGMPAVIEKQDTSALKGADGVTEMLQQLVPGDSVKTTMSISDFFNKLVRRPVPPGVDSAGSVSYTIKAREVMTIDNFIKWRETKVKTRDEEQITKYLAENKLEAKKDTSGIYYTLYTNNGGAKPTVQNCVEVKYEGKLLKGGRLFDRNDKMSFSLQQVIPGWQLAVPMLSKGDSATFYIPSRLAYRESGIPGAIPPDAVLVFNVQLLDFKNNFDPVTRSCK